jgi:hypothetical protein
MADEISLGKRTDNDTALDLLKFVFQNASDRPDSSEKILTLYQRCRIAMKESVGTN